MEHLGSSLYKPLLTGSPQGAGEPSLIGSAQQQLKEKAGRVKGDLGHMVDPDLYHERVEISLDDPSYKNVTIDDAAQMLGYFTQKMQDQGFPWSLHQIKEGKFTHRAPLSEMDALRNLKQGKEVLFQPKRDLQLDLSPDSLSAVAKLGGDPLKKVDDVATFSKNTKITPSAGIELRYGEPVIIKNFGELKLLYELYNPDVQANDSDKLGKAAHNLTFFTKKTQGTKYPWRFVKEGVGNMATRVLKAAVTKGIYGLVLGAGAGLVIGGPIGLITGTWTAAYTLMTTGAAIGAAWRGGEAAAAARKGVDINAYETLGRIMENKPVILQERNLHSVGFPLIGSINWYSDHGEGSTISSPEELALFNRMQNQPETPAKAAGTPEK
jgi:hypothetical protein